EYLLSPLLRYRQESLRGRGEMAAIGSEVKGDLRDARARVRDRDSSRFALLVSRIGRASRESDPAGTREQEARLRTGNATPGRGTVSRSVSRFVFGARSRHAHVGIIGLLSVLAVFVASSSCSAQDFPAEQAPGAAACSFEQERVFERDPPLSFQIR